MNINEAINSSSAALDEAGVAEPRREAGSLLAFALERDAAFLIAHPEYELLPDEAAAFAVAVLRRADREPFQYITGKQEFWGLEFDVEAGVLIPRPETEILVEKAIEILRNIEEPTFCEAGVGSGCISIAILHSVENATGVATDVLDTAISLASRNAAKHGVDKRLAIRKADLFDGLGDGFSLIVSNPPYIPDGDIEGLQPEVRDFEPRTALAGGVDGLDIVRRIIQDAPQYLVPNGHLLIEIGHGQSGAVESLVDERIWNKPEFLPDLQGIPRVLCLKSEPPA